MIVNNKEFFETISSLDTTYINAYLDDTISYNNCSKDSFLSKLDELFSKIKSYGNTQLSVSYLGAIEEVVVLKCNRTQHFLSFKIKKDHKYFELINYVDDEIMNNFNVSSEFQIQLLFFKDDMRNFVPNARYNNVDNRYLNNVLGIETLEKGLLDIDVLQDWLDDYELEYDALTPSKLQYRNCYKFYHYYNILTDYREYMELNFAAIEAVEAFAQVYNEADELVWLDRYISLYEELCCIKKYQERLMLSGKYCSIINGRNVIIDTTTIEDVLYFVGLFEACKGLMVI